MSTSIQGFTKNSAANWFVGEGDINRVIEDHTSSSIFIEGDELGTYDIRGNYPLNSDPSNDYVLMMLITSSFDNSSVIVSCAGGSTLILDQWSNGLNGKTFDEMELADVDGIGGMLRLPTINGTTYGIWVDPQLIPLQMSSFDSSGQESASEDESDSVDWWQSCSIIPQDNDVWITGTILRNKADVLERHFDTLNHEFNVISTRTSNTVDMLDDLIYSAIIVVGIILVIFIFVAIWKTFEYFVDRARSP